MHRGNISFATVLAGWLAGCTAVRIMLMGGASSSKLARTGLSLKTCLVQSSCT